MTDAPLPPAPPGGTRPCRALAIGLVVSLAVNVLIVGLVAGAALTHRPAPLGAPPVNERVLVPLGLALPARALDPADRRALIDAVRAERDALRPARREMQNSLAQLAEAARRDPFDRAAVRAALARQRAAIDAPLSLGEALLITRLSQMSPAARAAFADRLTLGARPRP